MISGATSGSGGPALGAHLADARSIENRHNVKTELGATRFLRSQDIQECVEELGRRTRHAKTATPLCHFHADPGPLEDISKEGMADYWNKIEIEFGFQNQPFVETIHTSWRKIENLFDVDDVRKLHGPENVRFNEEADRFEVLMRHYHRVYTRIHPDGSPITLSNDYARREKINRIFEYENGFQLTQGAHNRAVVKQLRNENRHDVADTIVSEGLIFGPRPVAQLNSTEREQQRRTGIKKRDVQHDLFAAWKSSDNATSFEAAINRIGYKLANGDKAIVAVDATGNVQSVGRLIAAESKRLSSDKIKSAAIDKCLSTLNIKCLNDVRRNLITLSKLPEISNVRPTTSHPARSQAPLALRDLPTLREFCDFSARQLSIKNVLQQNAPDNEKRVEHRSDHKLLGVSAQRAVTTDCLAVAPAPARAEAPPLVQVKAAPRPQASPARQPPATDGGKSVPVRQAMVAGKTVQGRQAKAGRPKIAGGHGGTGGGPISGGGKIVRPFSGDPSDLQRFLEESAAAIALKPGSSPPSPPPGLPEDIIQAWVAFFAVSQAMCDHNASKPRYRDEAPSFALNEIKKAYQELEIANRALMKAEVKKGFFDIGHASRAAAAHDHKEKKQNDYDDAKRFYGLLANSEKEHVNAVSKHNKELSIVYNSRSFALQYLKQGVLAKDIKLTKITANNIEAAITIAKVKYCAADHVFDAANKPTATGANPNGLR